MNTQIVNIFENKVIRSFTNENGDTWFCAKDVLEALGTKTQLRNIALDDPSGGILETPIVDALGRKQTVKFINESTLYEIMFKLNVESAKPFRLWVTKELIPSIRKNGFYVMESRLKQLVNANKRQKEINKILSNAADKLEHQLDLQRDFRNKHKRSRIKIINIETGKTSTLWDLDYDVKKYLEGFSMYERGMLFHRYKVGHNFNEFVRYKMKKGGKA